MSKPEVKTSLGHAIEELLSAQSALHMTDDYGEFIDEKYEMVQHSKDHIRAAIETITEYQRLTR